MSDPITLSWELPDGRCIRWNGSATFHLYSYENEPLDILTV